MARHHSCGCTSHTYGLETAVLDHTCAPATPEQFNLQPNLINFLPAKEIPHFQICILSLLRCNYGSPRGHT